MPYIKKKYRKNLKAVIKDIVKEMDDFDDDEIEGVLNFVLTTITNRAMKPEGGWRYYAINRTIGVLEAVKAEFIRRVAGPYEEDAVDINGDIDVYQEFDIERADACMRRWEERKNESRKAERAEMKRIRKVEEEAEDALREARERSEKKHCQCQCNPSRDT